MAAQQQEVEGAATTGSSGSGSGEAGVNGGLRQRIVGKVSDLQERFETRKDKVKESIKETLDQSKRRGKEIVGKASRRITEVRRKVITGDKKKRVRDYALEVPVVRSIDKVSFTLGVLVMCITEWVLAVRPECFYIWYIVSLVPLLAVRYFVYKREKFAFFLLDFCYFCQLLCVASLYQPLSLLRTTAFVVANGPLAIATIVWRSSLVFHSLDKVTSVYIHVFPAMLTYCLRWWPDTYLAGASDPATMTLTTWMVLPVGVYIFWQLGYILLVDVGHKERLEQDPELQTSIRWIINSKRHPLRDATIKACRFLGVLTPKEAFNADEWKTKIIFMFTQLLYTIVTCLPAKLFYENHTLHVAWMLFVFVSALWNGATYYIEAFARHYQAKLDKLQQRQALLARVASGEVVDDKEMEETLQDPDTPSAAVAAYF